jgi:serine/threonine-protein kinase
MRRDALVALVGLHEAGGIHRDLKPANILLRQKAPQSAAVIGDWGLTYWGEGGAGVKTTGGCGTAAYMAPEMWEAGGEYGAAVDIFALGATVFELVTAQRLF